MPNRSAEYADPAKARRTHTLQKRRYRRRNGAGVNPPREWTHSEDERVLAHAVPDRELATRIARSVGAIQKRRWVLRGKPATADPPNGG